MRAFEDAAVRHRLQALLLAALVVLAWLPQRAASDEPLALHELAQRSWTTREGLPHNSVNALAQTDDGYLWLATWEGVARYNGREFKVFGRETIPELGDVAMRELHVDAEGTLWVGGVRGDILSYREGRWQRLPPAPGFINALQVDALGRLWVGQESRGLLRIDPDGTRVEIGRGQGLPGDSVFDLGLDAEGRLWAATTGGLALVEDGRAEAVPHLDDGGTATVLGLGLDGAGRLLLATARGAFRARGRDPQQGFESLHPQLRSASVFRIVESADGGLWLGLSTDGLVRLDGEYLQRFGTRDGLPNGRVLSLLLDRDGALWTATNGGLLRLGPAPFSSLTSAQGLTDNFVRAVLRDAGGALWFGTGRGLNRWRAGALTPLPDPQLETLSVLSLAQGEGDEVLVGSFDRGVLRLRDGRVVDQIDTGSGLPSNQVRALLRDRNGVLWIGTIGGLARFDPAVGRAERLTPGPAGEFVIALAEDAQGTIWVGTPQGLDRVGGDGRIIAGPALPADTRSLFAITPEEGGQALWLSSDRGLLHLHVASGTVGQIGPAQGLPMEKVFHAVADGAGHLWLSSNRGAVRVRRDEARAVLRGQTPRLTAETFDEAHGMASSQCNTGSPAAALGPDGGIWIATAIGVARIKAGQLDQRTAQVPPTVIESVTAEGRELPLDAMPARLPPGTSRVGFSVAGLGYVMPERIHYRYRLEGFDTDWVERGRLHAVEYTNLPPGAYVLRTQAAYVGSPWASQEARFEFVIEPFFWQRPWVQALGLMLGLLLAYLLFRLRVRALRLRAHALQQAVARKTAELRASTDQLLAADAEKTRLLEQLREHAEAFERQAREDALTGLANRRVFDQTLAHEFRRARRTGTPLCLAMIDIDHFKRINDNYSHAAGDAVLVAVARVMREQCREMDVPSRWGGEEFGLLLPQTRREDAVRVCERLRAAFAALEFEDIDLQLRVSVSIGLADEAGLETHEALLARADQALYAAKHEGRDRVVVAPAAQ
jgi:diguanylate cyclase (GGDEF)-like protein